MNKTGSIGLYGSIILSTNKSMQPENTGDSRELLSSEQSSTCRLAGVRHDGGVDVEPAGEFMLKGFQRAVAAYNVLGVHERTGDVRASPQARS